MKRDTMQASREAIVLAAWTVVDVQAGNYDGAPVPAMEQAVQALANAIAWQPRQNP